MRAAPKLTSRLFSNGWLTRSVRTTLAAVGSLEVAKLSKLPEPYWATITTIIVMQSTLGASWDASRWRLVGTVLGALVGWCFATFFGSNIIAFALGLLGMGLICGIFRLDPTAYRFAGVTLAIITLISHQGSPLTIAAHRFAEVTIGIVFALCLSAVWPESKERK